MLRRGRNLYLATSKPSFSSTSSHSSSARRNRRLTFCTLTSPFKASLGRKSHLSKLWTNKQQQARTSSARAPSKSKCLHQHWETWQSVTPKTRRTSSNALNWCLKCTCLALKRLHSNLRRGSRKPKCKSWHPHKRLPTGWQLKTLMTLKGSIWWCAACWCSLYSLATCVTCSNSPRSARSAILRLSLMWAICLQF